MNITAPEDYIWICLACGKRSQDKYGFDLIDKGWDESCMLNSRMVKESDLTLIDGRIARVDGPLYETTEEIVVELKDQIDKVLKDKKND